MASAWHGKECTPRCEELAVQVTLTGPRAVPCPYCSATPGRGCKIVGPAPVPLVRFGQYHPSRLESAA
ncbi:zinc finger domain-containing protein [Friedmanniella luteola]|uniref:zinc finger domain-containing protein n=1 Tax=Friedmanniella luteola TaxID=546871 RepID=UPI003CCA4365